MPYFTTFIGKTPKKIYLSIQLGQRSQDDLEIALKHHKMPKLTHIHGRKMVSTMTSSSNVGKKASRN